MKFRWNEEINNYILWDPSAGLEFNTSSSDINIIKNPSRVKYESILRALCNIVVELVEIEEKRQGVSDVKND